MARWFKASACRAEIAGSIPAGPFSFQMKIDTLLRAKYDKNFPGLDNFIIVIKNRGSPDDKKEIKGNEIKEITKGHITLKDDTFIPAHRIIEIKKKD